MTVGFLGGVDVAAGAGVQRLVWLAVGLALAACGACLLVGCVSSVVRGRRERRIVNAWTGSGRPPRRGGVCPPGSVGRLRWREGAGRHRGRAQGPPQVRELALVVAEVSTRLRSGAPTSAAWARAMERIGVADAGGVDAAYPPIFDEWTKRPTRWHAMLSGGRAPGEAAARVGAASVIVACRFSSGLGAPLADVLDAIGDAIDDAQAVEEARRVASAGPLMSARVLAALPLVGVGAALALGASPWAFYTGGGLGSVCSVVGVAAWGAGIASCRKILEGCRRSDTAGPPTGNGAAPDDGALACDLVASALACGASIPRALAALAEACAHEGLAWTASALRVGASWEEAWEEAPTWARPLGEALEASWTSGTDPEGMLARCATWERRTRLVEAKTRAEELSVRLVAPLGIFFLPAFLALGIAPLLAHLMGGIEG